MKKIIFKGCGTAIITPFKNEGINFQEFEKLINDQIEGGVDSIIVCGTTGESSTMSLDERKAAIKFAIRVANHRIPIVAGTGANCTKSQNLQKVLVLMLFWLLHHIITKLHRLV